MAITLQDYADKEIGRKAISEARAKGIDIPQGRNPNTKEPVIFAYSDGSFVPSRSSVAALDLPGSRLPLSIMKPEIGSARAAEPGSGSPELIPSPDGTKWFTYSRQSLYLVSEGASTAMDITPTLNGDFDRVQLVDRARDLGRYLVWIENPMWNADGTGIVFVSNRKAISEGKETGCELWLANLDTGIVTLLREFDETPGVSGAHEGWVLCSLSDGVFAVSDSSGASRKLAVPGVILGYGAGKVFTAEGFDTRTRMWIADVATGASQVVEAPAGKRFSRAFASEDGLTYIAVASDTEAYDMMVVYEVQNGVAKSTRTIPLPNGFKAIRSAAFLDSTTILASVSAVGEGKISEAAYLLNLEGGGK